MEKFEDCQVPGTMNLIFQQRLYILISMKKGELTTILFAVLLISFLLPFVEVSCGTQRLKTITGIQMVTGFKIENPAINAKKPQTKKVKGEPLTRIAFALAILGFVLSFLKGILISKILSITGLAGTVVMLFLKTKIDQKVAETGVGLLAIDYKIGFWLILLLFVVIFIVNLIPEKGKT